MTYGQLGNSQLQVSKVALGSWKTFGRMSAEDGLRVMLAAKDAGITFLDDARYVDKKALSAEVGYSETLFGKLFDRTGWLRDDVVVANKLWWEFWPTQSAVDELTESLNRMGLAKVALIYAERPPADVPIEQLMTEIATVLRSGLASHWGLLNWNATDINTARRWCSEHHVKRPVAIQLPYSLLWRTTVEDTTLREAISQTGMSIVASHSLGGGVLSGKYAAGGQRGRLAGRESEAKVRVSIEAASRLHAFAQTRGFEPAALALAFVLKDPMVASVLVGATSAEQVDVNAQAPAVAAALSDEDVAELTALFPSNS